MYYDEDTKFCQLLIRARWVDIAAIHKCVAIQEEQAMAGEHPQTLAEVLVRKRYLRREQIQSIDRERREHEKTNQPKRRRFGPYEIDSLIARGGMGVVFKVRDTRTNMILALKILPTTSDSQWAKSKTRFLREATLACTLKHENLVSGIKIGKEKDIHYFVMEYVEGETLGQKIHRAGRLPEAEVAAVARQMASALAYANAHGIIHRDVKPDNILISRLGVVKLCDLGLARGWDRDGHLTTIGMTVGTPKYISPEQARGERDLDIRTDIYSLGITLFHALTGVPPFDGNSGMDIMNRQLSDPLPSIAELAPDVSYQFCEIVARMTEKNPQDRYQNPQDLLATLDHLPTTAVGAA